MTRGSLWRGQVLWVLTLLAGGPSAAAERLLFVTTDAAGARTLFAHDATTGKSNPVFSEA